MVYFEKVNQDGTACRIVTIPNEKVKKEVTTIQIRITQQGQKARIVSFPLEDEDFRTLVNALYKVKLSEIGRPCEKCGGPFLPRSPSHKVCDKCRVEETK